MKSFSAPVQEGIAFAAELLRKAKAAIVLTGAGISTPSGIPDFRSEGTGLWSRDEPLEVASLNTFRTNPEKFYAWFRPLASQIFNAKPNEAHVMLAKLEGAGLIHAVLTQNIDMLHQKAGSKRVIEMHGTSATLSCTQCFQQVGSAPYLKPFVEKAKFPVARIAAECSSRMWSCSGNNCRKRPGTRRSARRA